MTREEAIKGLKVLRKDFSGYKPNEEMFDMAIEALTADDVMRCKDCRHWYKKMDKCNRCPSISGNWGADDFCSYGERREP